MTYLEDFNGGSLVGKPIMHMHHNSGYGRESLPTLEALAKLEGFVLMPMPVEHPGEDQSAIWPQVMAYRTDYILLWAWGVMNAVALRGAIGAGCPVDQMMGIRWSAAESDQRPPRLPRAGGLHQRGADMGEARVKCRTPAAAGCTHILGWKFDAVRAAILDAIADGPISNEDLKDKVGARLDAATLETIGKLGWHVVTVELEVRG